MSDKALTIEQILTMLAQTPPRLAALTEVLAPAQLQREPNLGEWSANEVLAHLRSCADIWGNCIATIFMEDKPTLRAINPRTWIKKTDYSELEFGPSLQAFTVQRAQLLAVLKPLLPENWSRVATVTGRERYLSGLCYFMLNGWLATNGRTLSKLSVLSTQCMGSNAHRLRK